MQILDATQIQTLTNALIGFAVAILMALPFFVRARGKRAEAQADAVTAHTESDGLRLRASASRELLESDSLRFVLQVAQTSLQNSARISELERLLEVHRIKDVENQRQILEANIEIERLKKRIFELETELDKYRKTDYAPAK